LHIGEELLQALFAGSWDGSGHGVTIFIGQFGEQAGQIALQGGLALRAPELEVERRQKVIQLGKCAGTGMHIHGYPPVL
jgi:hypothetical protein